LRQRLIAASAASIVLAALAPAAGSPSNAGFVVGFDDDRPQQSGSAAVSPATTVGAGAFRFTLAWSSGETALTAADRTGLGTAVSAASSFRIVVSVYGAAGSDAPTDAAGRSAYCSYVADALTRYPSIRDVVIWNEPNKRLFWNANGTGQADAPAQYEALLATCYDSLHASFSGVNVIGLALSSTGNDNATSTSPGAFIRAVGDAYRASGRTAPLMDTVGFHPYPLSSSERPWLQHIGEKTIAEGDWNKLMYNLWLAFNGTAQPLPGSAGVRIWYLEDGFQTTVPPAKAGAYSGTENVATIPDFTGTTEIDQATQVLDAIRRAACQPYVGAFFNFMLIDDPVLTGWQSGPFWADGTAKGSLSAFQRATSEARSGTVDCSALTGGTPSADFMPPSAPPTPTAQTQTAPLAVTLSWPAASDDSAGPLGYRVYRNGGWIGTATGLTWTDGTVDDATTYSYAVRALDEAGNLGNASPAVSVTTPDVTPPSTPGSFSASAAGPTAVALAWTASTDNVGVRVYELSRDGTVLASVTGTSFTDNGVASASSHAYSIVAVDAAGNRSAAASAQLTLPGTPEPPTSGGGGGGGGGGSSSLGLTLSPPAQTVTSGSTTSWTISVTNTGGAYLYAVGVSGPAPGCGIPTSFAETAGFMAPGVTISYACSLAGVTASFTSTVVASATTGPGPVITANAPASVTVQAASPPPPAPAAAVQRRTSRELAVFGVKPVRLGPPKPKLVLSIGAPSRTTLVLTLFDGRGRKLAEWVKRAEAGTHRLALVLPPKARKAGRDRLRITATGGRTRTLPISVRSS
jgi:chitodextrinase